MNSILEWKLAFRNLRRNLRRTVSTGLALTVAYVGLAVLGGHVLNVDRSVKVLTIYGNKFGHVAIYKKGGIDNFEIRPDIYELTASDLAVVDEALSSVRDRLEFKSAFFTTPALLSTGTRSIPVMIQGVEPDLDRFVRTHPRILEGAPAFVALQPSGSLTDAVREVPDAISLSVGIREILGRTQDIVSLPVEDKEFVLAARTLDGDLNAVNGTFAVSHTTGSPYMEDVSVVAPVALVRDLAQTSGASHVALFLKNDADIDNVMKLLRAEFDRRDAGFEVLPFTDDRIGYFYNGTMSFLFVMVSFFAILILGASALIIVNSMTMSILERSREMGTLRAFGFTPERVRSLFVKEAFWLAMCASVVGFVASLIFGQFINASGWTIETAGVSYPIPLHILVKLWFHALIVLTLVFIATSCSYWLVRKKTKERISVLLLESGAAL